ncbi:substrate-binding domain-containing protein [Elioraea sp.]|uniref:substrate-binding domain-containing protein n=1 Tax=Elioraea sp. TaxID=2185103 RepID=UPI003F70DBDA
MSPHRATRRAALAGTLALLARPARPAGTLTVGLTPVFLDSDLALLRDLDAYLAQATGLAVRLVKRRTYQEITALLLAGQLDAAWICGYPFVQHAARLAVVAVPLHRGRPLYQSYLIVGADHAARRLADLRGTTHAFSDPDSNSGFLVTRYLLAAAGERPETFFARSFFTFGHRNVIRAVQAGLAEGGSVDGYVWEVMAEREPAIVAGTRVIARSDWHGFPPVACLAGHRRAPTVRALAEALARMPDHPVGRAVLATLQLDGFAAAEPALFDSIARMSAVVRAQT